MKRIAILGSNGQLGSDLVELLDKEGLDVIPLVHSQVDCTSLDSTVAGLEAARPEAVVNCAAFVRVDDCEDEQVTAFQVNAAGAYHVAHACRKVGALCVHISTDYVFDGEAGPYSEEDTPNPINVYGSSKLAGEERVKATAPEWLITRVSSLFGRKGARGKGGNFVETMIAKANEGTPFPVVDDIVMTPTYTRDASRAILQLLKKDARGLFHVANQGACTWYEFAHEILAALGRGELVTPGNSSDFGARARRPANSSLVSVRVDPATAGLLRPWREALQDYLTEKGHLSVE
jgi:dTDP-4-dehydrorhamnose reductase